MGTSATDGRVNIWAGTVADFLDHIEEATGLQLECSRSLRERLVFITAAPDVPAETLLRGLADLLHAEWVPDLDSSTEESPRLVRTREGALEAPRERRRLRARAHQAFARRLQDVQRLAHRLAVGSASFSSADEVIAYARAGGSVQGELLSEFAVEPEALLALAIIGSLTNTDLAFLLQGGAVRFRLSDFTPRAALEIHGWLGLPSEERYGWPGTAEYRVYREDDMIRATQVALAVTPEPSRPTIAMSLWTRYAAKQETRWQRNLLYREIYKTYGPHQLRAEPIPEDRLDDDQRLDATVTLEAGMHMKVVAELLAVTTEVPVLAEYYRFPSDYRSAYDPNGPYRKPVIRQREQPLIEIPLWQGFAVIEGDTGYQPEFTEDDVLLLRWQYWFLDPVPPRFDPWSLASKSYNPARAWELVELFRPLIALSEAGRVGDVRPR